MPKIPGLQKRGQTYHFRLRVPTDLVDVYGRYEINESLRTKDHSEARKKVGKVRDIHESKFDELRARLRAQRDEPDMLSSYSDHELERLAIRWYNEQRAAENKKLPEDMSDLTPTEMKEVLIDKEYFTGLCEDEVNGTAKHPEHYGWNTAHKYLKELGITFSPKSENFHRLGHLMSRALAEEARQDVRRWKGRPYIPSDELFINSHQVPTHLKSNLPKKTLEALMQEYLDDPEVQRTKGTEKNLAVLFRALKEMIGEDTQISDITRQDCKRVRDLLLKAPTNATKRARGKSLEEAAKLAEKNKWALLSPKTINNYLGNLNALMKFAMNEQYLRENPASGLKLKVKKKGKQRLPFEKEQLQKIFAAPLYTGCINDGRGYNKPGSRIIKGTRFWVPLIALYTGMRANEICQLELADFIKKDGIDFLHIREDDDEGEETKQVKTEQSIRIIPIHPELIKMGLMKYVEKLRRKREVRLCYDLRQNNEGYYSADFSKWFGRFLDNTDAKKKKNCFHSFRHNFRDAIREAELPESAAIELGGWSDDAVHASYGIGLQPTTLYKHICKIQYPYLDFSHLYIEEATDGHIEEDKDSWQGQAIHTT